MTVPSHVTATTTPGRTLGQLLITEIRTYTAADGHARCSFGRLDSSAWVELCHCATTNTPGCQRCGSRGHTGLYLTDRQVCARARDMGRFAVLRRCLAVSRREGAAAHARAWRAAHRGLVAWAESLTSETVAVLSGHARVLIEHLRDGGTLIPIETDLLEQVRGDAPAVAAPHRHAAGPGERTTIRGIAGPVLSRTGRVTTRRRITVTGIGPDEGVTWVVTSAAGRAHEVRSGDLVQVTGTVQEHTAHHDEVGRAHITRVPR